MTQQGRTLISDLVNEGGRFNEPLPSPTPIPPTQSTPPLPLPPLPQLPPPTIHPVTLTPPEDDGDIKTRENPTINLFDLHLDLDSVTVCFASIITWIAIWYYSGLFLKLRGEPVYMIVFVLFILYQLINMLTSDNKSGNTVYELNVLLTVEQMISILFGTVIIFVIFNNRLAIHPNTQKVVNSLALSVMILLSVASLWVNVFSSGRSFRFIRKSKQSLYNISVALFILIGFLTFKSTTLEEIVGAQVARS